MSKNLIIYALIPIASAMIGWLTNFIAVKMIFRPRKPVRILGFEIMGLIPKRKADLARKIGETVEKELISHKDIHNAVNTPGFHDQIVSVVMSKLDDFIMKALGGNPLIAMMLSGDTAQSIKSAVRTELLNELPSALATLFEKMESHIDFKEIVRRKIESFNLDHLETIVYAIADRELKAIEIFGGVLGFAVGLVQVAIIFFGTM